jgi:nitrate reductase gamma subunit
MSEFLKFLEDKVQIAALLFLAAVYLIRLVWLFRFKPSPEKTWAIGNVNRAIRQSIAGIALPKRMESARRRPGFYIQFVIFHLGVTAAITATFIIPYRPNLFKIRPVVLLFQVVIGGALGVAILRLIRRLTTPALRIISTPDDYASIILMILFFAAGILAVPNHLEKSEGPLVIFFGLTALLLVYVPFSKIGHYLYYPISRFYLGRMMGHRGVFPYRKAAIPSAPPQDKLQ